MAVFKTYTCDRCGEQNAQHYIIEAVDRETDAAGDTDTMNGEVDLCPKHSHEIIKAIFQVMSPSAVQRRAIWKKLLGKH